MTHEVKVLGIMTLCGAFLALLYDYFRGLHSVMRKHTVIVAVTDIAYWCAASALLLGCLYYFNDLKIRAYEFAGLFIGAILYFLTISRWVYAIFCKITQLLLKFVKQILKIVLTLTHFLYKITVAPIIVLLKKIYRVAIGGGHE